MHDGIADVARDLLGEPGLELRPQHAAQRHDPDHRQGQLLGRAYRERVRKLLFARLDDRRPRPRRRWLRVFDDEENPVAHPEVSLFEPPLDVGRLHADDLGRHPFVVLARLCHPHEALEPLLQVSPALGQAVGGRRGHSRLRIGPRETAQRQEPDGESRGDE